MYLLIIILNKEDYLQDVLSCLVELGVEDITALDSKPLEATLAYRVPIFSGLRLQLGERTPYSKTIFAVIDDLDIGSKLVRLLRTVGIDLEARGVARVIALKIESALGTAPDVNL